MDKREALEIYLKAHDECLEHADCKDCAFREIFGGSPMCILGETGYTPVAQWIRKNLNGMEEKQKVKPSVPLENVGSIIVRDPSNAKELAAALKDPSNMTLTVTESDKEHDNVNCPKHYCKGGVESIDFVKAAVSNLSGFEAVCVANIIKYMWRYKEKNGLEDVMKAAKYLEWLQEEVKNNG